ncbi:MAG: hypothetical protein PHX78_02140 [bacterium]|nr:hypothetical protein [bacterium]
MENEKKENFFDIVSIFVSIIIAGSIFSGLGRLISGIELYSGILDGFFISSAIFLSIFLTKIPFLERSKICQYPVLNSIIIGFFIGGIPGIILNNKLIFYTSGLSSSLLCFSFAFLEKYFAKKPGELIKMLFFYLLAGSAAGFIGNFVFNASVEISLLQSTNITIILTGALYGAIWGGLIIMGTKLSISYLKPLIKHIIPPVLVSAMHGIFIAIGTGLFGAIIETITYTNTNFDMTATGATSLSQAITLSFLRDAGFGLCFGFLFTILHNIITYKKIENPLFVISGAIAGFLAPGFVRNYFSFVLFPMDGLLLGIGIGLGVLVSNIIAIDENKKRILTLILSPAFGFLALLISALLNVTSKNQTFFYLLGYGILGAIYGLIIIFFKFVCDYYLETDPEETDPLYSNVK